MTRKEKAIREFAKRMRTALVSYIAEQGRFTPALEWAWFEYVDACSEETENVKPKR
jgi:hypothetical protein